MSSNFILTSENECNDGTGNHCEFVIIIYQSYPLTYLVLYKLVQVLLTYVYDSI